MEDLEGIDTSTREGSQTAAAIVSRAIFDGQAKLLWLDWLRSLKTNFAYTMPEEVQREAILLFQKNNFSFLNRASYDTIRRQLVRTGAMPQSALTEDEILAGSIENEDTQSWEGRRRLKTELIASRRRQPE
jgi:hypothetical protein